MKKFLFLVLALVGLLGVAFLVSSASRVEAGENYVLCHTNPHQSVTLEFASETAYNNHLNQPHNNQTSDSVGACDQDESGLPSVSAITSCGEVTLEFFNPTRYLFSFDYQIDDEEGHEDGTNPGVYDHGVLSTDTIANGPWAGYEFGLRYNEVDVDGGAGEHYKQVVIPFDEDSGLHTVSYRLWRGAENDWYLDWDIVEVDSNCKEGVVPEVPSEPKGLTPAGAPQCNDTTPLVLPSNVHVVRSGADATVNFFTSSSNANIYFRTSGTTGWQHALRDIPVTNGYVSVTIHDLNPTGDYDFGIQSSNSCAGGEVVLAVVEDDYSPRTFMFSWWEWL